MDIGVNLKTYASRSDAEEDLRRLHAHGLQGRLVPDQAQGFALRVFPEDVKRVRAVLEGNEAGLAPTASAPPHCPNCGSSEVDQVTVSPLRKALIWFFGGFFYSASLFPRYRCRRCGWDFRHG